MIERCPRCGNTDVTVRKYTLPSAGGGNATVYDYYCPKCNLLETINADEPGWNEAIERWQQQADANPEALEVYWYPDANGYHATVNTIAGKQKWRLAIGASEPRYRLFVDGIERLTLPSDQWPISWRLANGDASPLRS